MIAFCPKDENHDTWLGDIFCRICGTRLKFKTVLCEFCGAEHYPSLINPVRFCSKCGSESVKLVISDEKGECK